jgi:hypothetical protein
VARTAAQKAELKAATQSGNGNVVEKVKATHDSEQDS